MKRNVALLMALVMLLGVIPPLPVRAETALGVLQFQELKQRITYTDGVGLTLSDGDLGDDEVVMSWLVGAENTSGELDEGKYTLTYFLDHYETHKIVIDFLVGKTIDKETGALQNDDKAIGIRVKTYIGEDLVEVDYQDYPEPYDVANPKVSASEYYGNIRVDGMSYDREFKFRVGSFEPVTLFYSNGKINLMLGNVEENYISPFTLQYYREEGNGHSDEAREEEGFAIFKGLTNFTISPTHLLTQEELQGIDDSKLSDDGLPSQTVIDLSDEIIPGSRPGVVVKFDQPKVIKEGAFVSLDEVDTSGLNERDKPNATLTLAKQYTSGDLSADETGAHVVSFELREGASIKEWEREEGQVTRYNDQYELYFSYKDYFEDASDPGYQKVHTWDGLTDGMILNATMVFAGDYFDGTYDVGITDDESIAYPIKGVKADGTDDLGNTYVRYDIRRTGANTIALGIDTYDIDFGVDSDKEIYYNVYQSVYLNDVFVEDSKIEERVFKGGIDGTIDIFTGLVTGARYYGLDIGIDEAGSSYKSQVIQYDGEKEFVPLPYASITDINNVYVVPGEGRESDEAEVVGMDITWTVPREKDLEDYLEGDAVLYYELYASEDENQEGDLIKVFKVDSENNEIVVEPYAGTVNPQGVELPNRPVTSYDPIKSEITVRDVMLKISGEDYWERLHIEVETEEDDYEVGDTYPELASSEGEVGIHVLQDLEREIPTTLYFSIRPVYQSERGLSITELSESKSVSLDMTDELLPTISTIKADGIEDLDGYGGNITFTAVDLREYVHYALEPAHLALGKEEADKYKRIYEIYLFKAGKEIENEEDWYIAYDDLPDNQIIEVESGEEVQLTIEQRTILESSEGIPILRLDMEGKSNDDVIERIMVKGLEANTSYYVQGRVRIERWDLAKDEPEEIGDKGSIFSKYVTFTTDAEIRPPSAEEEVPPAPDAFGVVEIEEGKDVEGTATLTWEEPSFKDLGNGESIHYELVRSDRYEMNRVKVDGETYADDSRMLSLQDLINRDDENQYTFFSTKGEGDSLTDTSGYIEKYNKETGKWYNVYPQSLITENTLIDNTLLPNTIYYYYIRTVYRVNGEEVRSQWIMTPVTTMPINRPIQLHLESEEVYPYDDTSEMILSFLAPVPTGGEVGDGKDYQFEIAIKGEDDQLYYLANDVSNTRDYHAKLLDLDDLNNLETGNQSVVIGDRTYQRFYYKLSGLDHGSRYDIKVRIVDKTSGEEVRSLYSEVIVGRTSFDQDEQDRDDAYTDSIATYRKEAERLKNRHYWVVESEDGEAIYKYREIYLEGGFGTNDIYELVTNDEASRHYFYLPKETFVFAEDLNTMTEVALGDYTINLRPTVLKNHDLIEEAEHALDDRDYEDYYIGLEIEILPGGSRLKGEDVLGDFIAINMEIVYMEQSDLLMEDDIMGALLDLIDEGEESLVAELEDELDGKEIEEEVLLELIEDEISHIEKRHEKEVENLLSKQIDDTELIESPSKEMLIINHLDTQSANAYYKADSWEAIYPFQTAHGYAIEAEAFGTYAFTGAASQGTLLPTIPGAGDLVNKYHLTEFFELDERSLKGNVTKEQLYGSVARMIGASRGTDYVLALRNRGIELLMPQNVYQTVRMDEVIYVIMQAYEKMYYKPVTSIYITNRQSVQNIGAFQPQLRPYVYGAVELGVASPINGMISPIQGVTVETFLRMLTKIMPN